MKQLELKDLAPYLPYGLQCRHTETGDADLNIYGASQECIMNGAGNLTFKISDIKPLLIPLSEFDGWDKFGYNSQQDFINAVNWEFIKTLYHNELCKQHYDVFDLIPVGLALNKLEAAV